jgi:hypothetical protein
MTLTDEQKNAVREWVRSGASLNEIQDRLRDQWDIRITYMEARLLLIDLDLNLHEPSSSEPAELAARPGEDVEASDPDDQEDWERESPLEEAEAAPPKPSKVRVSLDTLAIPGSIASGKVTFSDGKSGGWYLDQMGRLGLVEFERTYQPPPEDVAGFQRQLQQLLRTSGY